MKYFRSLSYLLFTFLFVSCATVKVNPINYKGYSVEKEIAPYLVEFEKACNHEAKIHVRFENIKWDLFKKDVAGYCFNFGIRYIHIDYNWWLKNPLSAVREELIFHELGHCLLNKDHNSEMIVNDSIGGRPKSIMFPYVFGRWGEYELHRQYYIEELCGKK